MSHRQQRERKGGERKAEEKRGEKRRGVRGAEGRSGGKEMLVPK